MLARVWRSRFTWKASLGLTAAGCLTIFTAAGIQGTPGTVFALVFLVGWFVLLVKMSDNEARYVVQLRERKGLRRRHGMSTGSSFPGGCARVERWPSLP